MPCQGIGWESACKPGSVLNGHSSGMRVTAHLKRPTRGPCGPHVAIESPAPLFGLAPGGVYPATAVTSSAVRSYRTISPLPTDPWIGGGIFSVALSVARASQALPGTLPVGARTFLRLFQGSDHPADSRREGSPILRLVQANSTVRLSCHPRPILIVLTVFLAICASPEAIEYCSSRFGDLRITTMSNALMAAYNRLPVSFERGDGVWLWDTEGKRYLDALSGIAVCGLGHAIPLSRGHLRSGRHTVTHL